MTVTSFSWSINSASWQWQERKHSTAREWCNHLITHRVCKIIWSYAKTWVISMSQYHGSLEIALWIICRLDQEWKALKSGWLGNFWGLLGPPFLLVQKDNHNWGTMVSPIFSLSVGLCADEEKMQRNGPDCPLANHFCAQVFPISPTPVCDFPGQHQCVNNLMSSPFLTWPYGSSTVTVSLFRIHFYYNLPWRCYNKENQEVIVAAQLAIIYIMFKLGKG